MHNFCVVEGTETVVRSPCYYLDRMRTAGCDQVTLLLLLLYGHDRSQVRHERCCKRSTRGTTGRVVLRPAASYTIRLQPFSSSFLLLRLPVSLLYVRWSLTVMYSTTRRLSLYLYTGRLHMRHIWRLSLLQFSVQSTILQTRFWSHCIKFGAFSTRHRNRQLHAERWGSMSRETKRRNTADVYYTWRCFLPCCLMRSFLLYSTKPKMIGVSQNRLIPCFAVHQ